MSFPRLAAVFSLMFAPVPLSAQGYILPGMPYSYTFTHVSGSGQHLHIPPIPNAPFSATVLLNTSNPSRSYEVVARDRDGRIFEELYSDIPVGVCSGFDDSGCRLPAEPWVTDRIYIDPVQHTAYDCISKGHLCHVLSYSDMTSPNTALSGPAPHVTVKDLGKKKMDGVQAIGTLQTGAGAVRRHRGLFPQQGPTTTAEVWYSPELQIDLKAKCSIYGATQSLQVKDLKRSEPNPKLFVLPAKYQLTSSPPPPPPADPDEQEIRKTIQSRITKSH